MSDGGQQVRVAQRVSVFARLSNELIKICDTKWQILMSKVAQSCGRSRKLGSLLTLLSNLDHQASKALSGTVSLPNDARKLKALAIMRWASIFVVTGEAVAE